MKHIITILLMTLGLQTSAQNYQCVSSNTTRYFTNNTHYLRGIKVDSSKTINGNTFLYPFKTARGSYNAVKDTIYKKGCWLGEQITILQDGTHLFKSYNGDTVIIKAQAQLNDTWLLYNDTSSTYYEATVTQVDTANILGSTDSIKTITVTAKDGNGIKLSDNLHNKKITLSKQHGFLSVFNLYNLPQLGDSIHGQDYFDDKAGEIEFNLIDLYNPSKQEIYNYTVGDIWQQKGYYLNNNYYISHLNDAVISKNIITSNEIRYSIKHTSENFETPSQSYPNGRWVIKNDTTTFIATSDKLLDLSLLPEEWGMTQIIKYNPTDTQHCTTNKHYSVEPNYITNITKQIARVNTFEPCGGPYNTYKIGIGELSYSFCHSASAGATNPTRSVTYTKINNAPCGKHYPVNINATIKEDAVKVYPSPANSTLTVELSLDKKQFEINLCDITGKPVTQKTTSSSRTNIQTSSLASGIYLMSIANHNRVIYNKKVVIQH